MATPLPSFTTEVLDRMVLAVEQVKDRLLRSTAALEADGVPYAVIGGNAVGAWVAKVDIRAVRNTVDVDLLLRESDLDAATVALAKAGFMRRHVAGIDCFLDGRRGKFRDAVHIIFAGKKVREEYVLPAPDVEEAVPGDEYRVLSLEALVRMKLTSFRPKDQAHLIDMVSLRMIDANWCDRYPEFLAQRLKLMIEDPSVEFLDDHDLDDMGAEP
ncbi:MAG TPA: hypothetical protein VFG20_05980 [Planctomycetaceae bacterium]|jgi:hypothetical protein|nr:hypothetical protein [Planctomycetaceae bacterium]